MDTNVYTMYTHSMKTCIQKWGNSLAIRIPKTFALELGMHLGKEVELSKDIHSLKITPHRLTIDELMANVTPDMLHEVTDWGPSVGKEI